MAYLLEKINEIDLNSARDIIVAQLEKKKMFRTLTSKLNKAIDVPFVGEKKEAAAIKAILREVISALKDLDLADNDDEEETEEDKKKQA